MRGQRVAIDVGLVVVWWVVAFAASALTLQDTMESGLWFLPLSPFSWSTLLVGPGAAGGVVGLVLCRTRGTWVDVAAVVGGASVVVGVVGGWRHDAQMLPGYLADDRVVAAQLGLYALGAVIGLALGLLAVRGLPSAVLALVLAAWWLGAWSVTIILDSRSLLSDTEYQALPREPEILGRPLSWLIAAVALVAVGVLAGRVGAWLWALLGAAVVLAAEIGTVSASNVAVLVRPGAENYDVVGEAVGRLTQILPAYLRLSYPWEPLVVLAVGVVIGALWAAALRARRTSPDAASDGTAEGVPTDAA